MVAAKPKKVRDPEIVELSSSEEEEAVSESASQNNLTSTRRQSFPVNPDEPIEISSGSDTEAGTQDRGSGGQGLDNSGLHMLAGSIGLHQQRGFVDPFDWSMWADNSTGASGYPELDIHTAGGFGLGGSSDPFSPSQSYGDQRRQKKKKRATPPPPPAESSDEDDLIVVKTDYNTVDPITKKEIVEPVRNKKCNHVYEKSTIYSMIDLARENSKPVRCPYMGCNCRDFKKTDLVKDREVAGHLTKVKGEREAEAEQSRKAEAERQRAKAERRQKRKEQGGGNESDQSADSIIEDVIEIIKGNKQKERQAEAAAAKDGGTEAEEEEMDPTRQDDTEASKGDSNTTSSGTSSSAADTSNTSSIDPGTEAPIAAKPSKDDTDIAVDSGAAEASVEQAAASGGATANCDEAGLDRKKLPPKVKSIIKNKFIKAKY